MQGLGPVDLNFEAIAPLLTLAVAGLVTLVLDLLLPKERSRPWWYISALGGLLVALWYVFGLWGRLPLQETVVVSESLGRLTHGISVFGGAYIVDRFTLIFSAIVIIAAFGAGLMSAVRQEEEMSGYLALILGAALGMCVLVGAGNLLTLFLGLEILSLNLYVAVAFRPDHRPSKEAALKYLILGSVATAVMLYGFAFLYGQTGNLSLASLASGWADSNTMFMKIGLGLSLLGMTFKMALAPFHVWAPDVYQGATSPITAFMSVGTKGAAFGALVRLLMALLPASYESYMTPLWVLAVASMIIGSFGAVLQSNVKRLLAYSSVTHAGYLMMALLGMTNRGMQAGAFYMLAYLFMNIGAFAVVVWLGRGDEEGEHLSDFSGLFYRRPVLALSMTLFLLSLAGFPPAGGFPGKLFLILSALASDTGGPAYWLVATLVATTAVSAFAYLRVVTAMFRREGALAEQSHEAHAAVAAAQVANPSPEPTGLAASGALSWPLVAVVSLAAVGTLYLGLLPKTVLGLADRLLPLL